MLYYNSYYTAKELAAIELIVNSLAKETTKSKANKDNDEEFDLDKEMEDSNNV